MEDIEIWKPISGYEGLYEVSDKSRVRSVDRQVVAKRGDVRGIKGRILRPGTSFTGYLSVALCRDGGSKTANIHALIAAAFLGPRPEGHVIDHIDGDRKNNKLENLRYVTPQTNTRNTSKVNSKSGVVGVYVSGPKWMAMAQVRGKSIYLGSFETIADAAACRAAFNEKHDWRGLGT